MMDDKKIAGTQASTATSGVGTLVGGYFGGYPGAMIGMALGSLLFKPDEPKNKDYSNTDYKQIKSKLDPVPDVIGTDLCPGKVIYFNKDTFGVYSSNQLPSMGDSVNEIAWIDFIDIIGKSKTGYWAEFAVNFSNKYLPGSEHHIGVIKFNRKPFWFWLIISDMFENYDDALDPYDPISVLDAAQNSPGGVFDWIDIEAKIGQDVNVNTIMYFKGFLADFTALSTAPETSNITIDVNNLMGMNPDEYNIGSLQVFPTFFTEMNRDDVWMSPESMQGGAGEPGTTLYQDFPLHEDWYTLNGVVWNQRDARSNYFVGLSTGTYKVPVFYEGAIREWAYCGNVANEEHKDAYDWFLANVTKGEGSWLQSTDVHDDRVYVCAFRNWENPDPAVAPTINHHHAEFGVEFDLYYHDRSDPTQKVTSVLYNHRYSTPEGEGQANPRLQFQSMQVDANYVYIFGGRIQTDIILSDRREILAGANSYTKIYADFSQYPDGFWDGYYAALGQNGSTIWREITEQTSTYITVANDFAALPVEGGVIYVCKYPKSVAEWGIVGEGSTKTEIICNIPGADPWWGVGVTEWDKCYPIGEWILGADIESIDGTVITLASELQNVPVPGERICFTLQSSTDFDQNVVDPIMTEYASMFLSELGFDHPTKADLAHLYANRIEGNELNYSHHICWRIDKNTGSIEVFDTQRLTTPTYYIGTILTFTGGINVFTCSTDKQAFIYSHESQYGTQMAVYSYILDFDSGMEEEIHRRHNNDIADGHTPAWCYFGCVPIREWNFATQQYEDVWYTILKSFDSSNSGLVDVADQGTYFLKLSEGKFSNKEIISSNITLYLGLDLDRRGIQKLLYRKDVATGPLYSDMYSSSYPDENNYFIGKFGITEDIYFYISHSGGQGGTGISAGPFEMWKYVPPTDINPTGELYCIAKSDMETDEGDGFKWLALSYGGIFKQSRYGFYGNDNGRWYMCDESPPKIIYEFWENYTDPRYFPVNMVGTLLYDDALEICNEIIDATIYSPKEEINLKERRFQFSQCYDQPRKMHDVINEILVTCQGFISPCKWSGEVGRFKIIIPNADEVPVHYFGRDSANLTSNQLSDTKDYIYADFSDYPDDYWKGDLIDLGEEMDFVSPIPDRDWAIIIEQTSTYVKVDSEFSDFYPNAKPFSISKDNIKEGSFTFGEKSIIDRPNKVRIEFKNRLMDYVKDVAEADDTYRLEILGEEEKIDFYKMHGIKRATQAGRLALRILDQWNYQKHKCAFDTDIMGMTLCMGDIIGVSHDTTGWNGKWFRIVAIDELMDFEVKFALEEFNPYCYHDSGVPVMSSYSYGGFPEPYIPNNVERFQVREDIEFNRLYFTFKAPINDGGFFIGARIYHKVGDTWEFITLVNETVSSVKLAQDVGINDTTIYYDNDYLSGSFATEGAIWIENELMYYHGLDTVNYAFTNVVRGYKDTDQVEHLIEDNAYIILRDDVTIYFEMPDSWAGTSQTFRASAFTIHSLSVGIDISPQATIDIVGYGILPYFPESIQNKLLEFETLFETIGLTHTQSLDEIEQLIESLGLGDTTTITEFLLALAESLGLGDNILVEATEYITETLGLNDTDSIAEMLLAISESLGLNDALEAVEDEEGEDAAMMVLQNNLL
jgi:hypothetical protein